MMTAWMTRVLIGSCLLGLVGCSQNGFKFRMGPVGVGIAATASPGAEFAISDNQGQPLFGARLALDVPWPLSLGWAWLTGHAPDGSVTLLGNSATPTGPVP
jgi:hypothetical protein